MEPTLHTNDVLLTERISVRTENVRNGDIVVSKCPYDPKQHICKRVVGLPGDKLKNGVVVCNVKMMNQYKTLNALLVILVL